jgi:hypothetical protein
LRRDAITYPLGVAMSREKPTHIAEGGNPGLSVLAIERARGIENSIG